MASGCDFRFSSQLLQTSLDLEIRQTDIKMKRKNYNRVNIRELNIRPSFELDVDKYNSFRFYGAYQLYKVLKHGDKSSIPYMMRMIRSLNTTPFLTPGLEYAYKRPLSKLFTNFEFSVSSGWKVSLRDIKRNFPYSESRAALELSFSKRFSWATMLKGTVLYNDKYEFYQAATTELRGFRNNRFHRGNILFTNIPTSG